MRATFLVCLFGLGLGLRTGALAQTPPPADHASCIAACTEERERCCAGSSPCSTSCADANRWCEMDCDRRFSRGPAGS